MGVRIAVLVPLAALVPLMAQLPPRMFSPWYAKSLRDILELEESDVAQLEKQLAANPDDFPVRLKLMAYYRRGDRASVQADRAKRVHHALWLIEHHPDSEILHSPVSRFTHEELTAADYRRAVVMWNAAAKARPANATGQWNAASFFEDLDPELYMALTSRLARFNHLVCLSVEVAALTGRGLSKVTGSCEIIVLRPTQARMPVLQIARTQWVACSRGILACVVLG
jgi:hypothetical protein